MTGSTKKKKGANKITSSNDIHIEATKRGIYNAKFKADFLFWQGLYDESLKWFSKAIWVIETRLSDRLEEFRHVLSILHSCKALVFVKQCAWFLAERACTRALELDARNSNARFQRAEAYLKLGKLASAKCDIDIFLENELHDCRNFCNLHEASAALRIEIYSRIGQPLDDNVETKIEDVKDGDPAQYMEIACTTVGFESAKEAASLAAIQGKYHLAHGIYSKVSRLIEENKLQGIPRSQRSHLHLNHARVCLEMGMSEEVEVLCTKAIICDIHNLDAQCLRSEARKEVEQHGLSLEDIPCIQERKYGDAMRTVTENNAQIRQGLDKLHLHVQSPINTPHSQTPSGEPSEVSEGKIGRSSKSRRSVRTKTFRRLSSSNHFNGMSSQTLIEERFQLKNMWTSLLALLWTRRKEGADS